MSESTRPDWVEAMFGLRGERFRIWCYLRRRQGDNSHAYPAQATIAKELGLSERYIRQETRAMQRDGWLQITWPEGPGRGAKHSLRYVATCPKNRNHSSSIEDDKTGTTVPLLDDKSGTTVPVKSGTTVPENTTQLNTLNNHSSSRADAIRLATLLRDLILQRQPKARERKAKMDVWADDIDKIIRIDEHTPEEIEAVILWCQGDSFWRGVVRCGRKLRDKYDTLQDRMNRPRNGQGGSTYDRDYSHSDGQYDYTFDLTPAMS